MNPSFHHVALLVRSAAVAGAICQKSGYDIGPVEDFPSEGTREIYVGSSDEGLLLIMEPIGPGPYQAAMQKRGPGLHHIAVHVESIEEYMQSLAGSGWLLHPMSLHTLAHRKTVYLARPGFKALIEVQQASGKTAADGQQRFVSEVVVEGERGHQRLLDALCVPGLRMAGTEGASLVICGQRVPVTDLSRG